MGGLDKEMVDAENGTVTPNGNDQRDALVTANQALSSRDIDQFRRVINSVEPKELPILLYESCEKGLIEFVDHILLHDGVDLNIECKKPERFSFLIAAKKGYHQILDSLLRNLKSVDKLKIGIQQTDKWKN